MKKFFIALSVLAALMLSVVPSQAYVSIADDTPGCDAIVPFIADISGDSGLNTLIAFADVLGGWLGTNAAPVNIFHYTVNTTQSDSVHDGWIKGTTNALISTDAFTILSEASSAARTALEVDLDGDGTVDHYAGYIYFDNVTVGKVPTVANASRDANTTVGQFFFVNLAAGKAAASNVPMKEFVDDSMLRDFLAAGFYGQMVQVAPTAIDINMELFSPNSMQGLLDLQAGLNAPTNAPDFSIFPRIFVADATAANWWIFWKSAINVPVAATLHANFWNEDEKKLSASIPFDNELEIIDASTYLPSGLWTGYPHSGYADLTWPTNTVATRALETLGWTYIQVTGSAQQSWTTLTPMWTSVRDR